MEKELTPLDALKYLKENKRRHWLDNDKSAESLDIIEKELKALAIIKKKWVDMGFLFEEWEEENYEFALENYNFNHDIELTQEEYDLLKEVLEQ